MIAQMLMKNVLVRIMIIVGKGTHANCGTKRLSLHNTVNYC